MSNHRLYESNKSFLNQLSIVFIPNNAGSLNWSKVESNHEWGDEIIVKNETWKLVDFPPGKKPVGCHWIYTMKYKTNGSIEHFKARLVVKGYTQTYGIDYIKMFVLVAKINTIWVLLSLTKSLDWLLQQFDVKNAFLHNELSEEVYMELPPGCMASEKQSPKVCRLKKSLYGLK